MFYVYQQTEPYRDSYIQIATNEDQTAAINRAKAARLTSGGCAVVTSVNNAVDRTHIAKPTAGVVFDTSKPIRISTSATSST